MTGPDRGALAGFALFFALFLALMVIPLPSDRAAREGRLRCDLTTQTCTTHATTARDLRNATPERR